jgi:PAS domain S-box-containing protein
MAGNGYPRTGNGYRPPENGPPVPGPPPPATLEGLQAALRRVQQALDALRGAAAPDDPAGEPRDPDGDGRFEDRAEAQLVTNLSGVIQRANHAAADLLQTHPDFLTGKPLLFLVAPDRRRDFATRLLRVSRRVSAVETWETRLQKGRAAPVDVLLSVALLPAAGREPGGLRWVVRDVTGRKHAERALQAERNFADRLIEAARAIVLVLDGEGRVVRSNPYVREVSGYGADELFGRCWWVVLVPEEERRLACGLWMAALARGTSEGTAPALLTRAGRRRAVAWSCRALVPAAGGPLQVLVLGHDITELQEAQRQAVQAERLAAVGQMAAALAHDGRNALQRGRACLERLRWKLQDRPDELDLVGRALRAQDDLLRLFEDVRAYAAPVRLDCRACNVAEVWREAWAAALEAHPGRDAALEEYDGCVSLWCYADGFRLRQVFLNVLDNALDACPDPARVTVACREADLGGRPALVVAVRDNGPGLGPEERRRLFEPFFTTKAQGTGLGLAIARRLVEAHGGQVAAGDGPRAGAEILITLPRARE